MRGILAVGVTFVLLTAGVDLSLGSVVALSGVACATFAHPGDHPVFVPIAVGLLTGAACGLVNGESACSPARPADSSTASW